MEADLKTQIVGIKTAFKASLDPMCVVDGEGQIVASNSAMNVFFGFRARDIKKKPKFADLITFGDHEDPVGQALTDRDTVRLDEAPAKKGDQKLRVLIKIVPIMSGEQLLGALISLRDTTGEILVQAKYHKLMFMLEEKDGQIHDLKDQLRSIRNTLRMGKI